MSVRCTTRVWEQSQHGGAALLLLLAIADWADDWGYCHPSVDYMAGKIRQSKRNTLRLIETLVESGELRIVKRAQGGRGNRHGTLYQVTVGLTLEQVRESERLSPLARDALEEAEKTMSPASQFLETGDKLSPVSVKTGDNSGPDLSPVFFGALKELINVSDINTTSTTTAPAAQTFATPEMCAEALYREVRPSHVTIPRSEQYGAALDVLLRYLHLSNGDITRAADMLRPFAQEADRRGINQTNLCWLTEWAAAGKIPQPKQKGKDRKRGNGHGSSKNEPTEEQLAELRRQAEEELRPVMAAMEQRRQEWERQAEQLRQMRRRI